MSENKEQLSIVMKEIEEKTTKKVSDLMNPEPVNLETSKIKMTANPLYSRGLKKTVPLSEEEKVSIENSMDRLTNILKEGGDEFKEKMGRNITYS